MPSPFARMAAVICFGPAAGPRMDRGACPDCGDDNPTKDIKTDVEFREFQISGLCKSCQDKVFS